MLIGDDESPVVEDETGTVAQTLPPPFPFRLAWYPAFITLMSLIDVNEPGGDDTDHGGGDPICNIRKGNLSNPSLTGI
jgi:hypothetical protein